MLSLEVKYTFARPHFDKLNTSRVEEGFDPFQNSRNTASGSLRLKDAQTVRSQTLEGRFISVCTL